MLTDRYLWLFSVLLSTCVRGQSLKPQSVLDDITKQLSEVKESVRSSILKALADVDVSFADINTYEDEWFAITEDQCGSEHRGYLSSYQLILESRELDPNDSCAKEQLANIVGLLELSMDKWHQCLAALNEDVVLLNGDTKYRIDMLINEVNIFDFQIERCKNDDACLQLILEQILAADIDIKQKINKYVDETNDNLEDLKVSIRYCNSLAIYYISIHGPEHLRAVAAC